VRLGVGQRKRIRLRAEFGTPEFAAEYQAALSGHELHNPSPSAGTLSWLINCYRGTTAWTRLSLATRRQRENIFKQILKTAAEEPVTRITKTAIIAGRDRRAQTPSQSRHFLQAMRGLFRWALDADHVKVDPTHSVEDPPRPKSGGFPIWTEDDVAAYERRWPVGTRQRVWLDVLLYTGLRRGDAVRLGRQHVKDGIATILTEKSGFTLEVSIPILPVLAATLKVGPRSLSARVGVR
jgi:integrase